MGLPARAREEWEGTIRSLEAPLPFAPDMAKRRRRAESGARQREHEAFLAGLGNLKYGMSYDQVIGVVGRPDKINERGGRWGARDQWIYKREATCAPCICTSRNPRAHRELKQYGHEQLAEFLLLNQLYQLEQQAEIVGCHQA